MDLSDGFPESSRARLLPECGAELPPNPVVRTPTAGLLIDLGLDPPSVTKMVSEVGYKSETCQPESANRQEGDDDKELIEANFLGREYRRPVVRTQGVASAGPGIPHAGALWSDDPSPVVLFRGSRMAPVQRGPKPTNDAGADDDNVVQRDDLTCARLNTVNMLSVENDKSPEGSQSLNRKAKFKTLVDSVTRQLHGLGYDWEDVRDYHRALITQQLWTPVDSGSVFSPNCCAAVVRSAR